jgi:hypothetical protein
MKASSVFNRVLLAVAAASLVACGGGGDGMPEPPPVVESAAACFSPAAYEIGARASLAYTVSGDQAGSYTSNEELVGQTLFNGVMALERVIALESTVSAPFQAQVSMLVKHYSSAPSVTKVITEYGDVSEAWVNGIPVRITSIARPPYEDPSWTLTKGQSYTAQITIDETSEVAGVPQAPTTMTGVQTITFLGYETVSVPAGTFVNACKWQTSATVEGVTTTGTQWVTASGQGVTVKTFSSDDFSGSVMTQLTSGTVNGQVVR